MPWLWVVKRKFDDLLMHLDRIDFASLYIYRIVGCSLKVRTTEKDSVGLQQSVQLTP
jgi:hypothetical protein